MSDEPTGTVEFQNYVEIARRRRAWIVLGIVLGLAISVAQSRGGERFRATAIIQLQARGIDAAGLTAGRSTGRYATGGTGYFGDPYQSTFVVRSKLIRDRVERKLGYLAFVNVGAVGVTDLIQIIAETSDPKTSADVANAFATEYQAYRREQTELVYAEAIAGLNAAVSSLRRQGDALEIELGKLPEKSPQRSSLALLRATYSDNIQAFESRASSLQVNSSLFASTVELIDPAIPPTSSTAPSRRDRLKNGILVGIVLATLFVAIAEFFDRRLTEISEVQRTVSQPVLASIPRVIRWRLSTRPHVGTDSPSTMASTEAYRALRSLLLSVSSTSSAESRVFVFNASRPRSGTSTTALNLAHLMAAGGRSTLLLDLDAQTRASSSFTGLVPSAPGFAEFVDHSRLDGDLVALGNEGLLVMGPGQMPKAPAEFLAEPRVHAAIGRLRAHFEVILIDTPALLVRNDALSFSALADAVILVSRLGHVTQEDLDDAIRAHKQAGASVAGIVMTGVRGSRIRKARMIRARRRRTARPLESG